MKGNKKNLLTLSLIALLATAVMTYIYPQAEASSYKYEQGMPWNYAKLIAPFDIDIYLDSATIKAKTDSVRQNHIPVYVPQNVNIDSLYHTYLKQLRSLPQNLTIGPGLPIAPNLDGFAPQLKKILTQAYSSYVLPDSAPGHNGEIRILISQTQMHKTPVANLYTPLRIFRQLDSAATQYRCHLALLNSGINNMLPATVQYSPKINSDIITENTARFTAATGRILRGQTIIDKGAIITAQDFTNLRHYETLLEQQTGYDNRSPWLITAGHFLYIALLTALLLLYIFIYEPAIARGLRNTLFLISLVMLFFILAVITTTLLPKYGIYLVPTAIVPILAVVYFNARTAMMTGLTLTLLCAPLASFPLEYIFIQITGMASAVFALRDLTERRQLLQASVTITATYLLAYTAVNLMTNGSFDDFQWRMAGSLTLCGALSAMAYILMSVVERIFGFISNVTLVELSDTNTPLLRKLSDQCPGTFQHSVAVANLASDAARLLGANVLLTRAGAMYHDIGKLANPIFFTENQHGVNPHDGLPPEKSASIIISHVTQGQKMAEKAGLPTIVRNFITQHHGAGRAKYFYFTACKNAPEGTQVDPAPFTYPGPNPQTREASILMMADSVEAASRSLPQHTPKAIRDLVDKIIDSQIADGLHNQSPISFADVQIVKDAFARRLMTMYHSRISYPDDPTTPKA